jgi:hypothetical protein
MLCCLSKNVAHTVFYEEHEFAKEKAGEPEVVLYLGYNVNMENTVFWDVMPCSL